MITSIQHFCENGVKRLTNVFKTYTDDLTKIAEMVYGCLLYTSDAADD